VDDAVAAEATLHHDLDVVGVGEGVRQQTVIVDRIPIRKPTLPTMSAAPSRNF
jgi:hypothetical protein